MSYQERTYRSMVNRERFMYFPVVYQESDLLIACSHHKDIAVIREFCFEEIIRLRKELDLYISKHPEFADSLVPLDNKKTGSCAADELLEAAAVAGTGPMAGVAGLFSAHIGRKLKEAFSLKEVVIENGGDIYASVTEPLKVAVYAGRSVLSNKLNLIIKPGDWGICTSSGTVGHSLSFGKADALTVVSRSAVYADCLATSLANKVQGEEDIEKVLEISEAYEDIQGILIIAGDKVGMRGDLSVCQGDVVA